MLLAERREIAPFKLGVVIALTIKPFSEASPLDIGLEVVGKTGARFGKTFRVGFWSLKMTG